MAISGAEGPLAGRVALVTGASRGIGGHTARELARMGAAVALTARGAQPLREVAAELSAGGARCAAFPCELTDGPARARLFEAISSELGPVDVLINNAGAIGAVGPTAEVDPRAFEQTLELNLLAAFHCLRAVLPGMLERRWGRIINVSSFAATGAGIGRAAAYSVSKAGLEMLTRAVAAEVAGSGVQVNAVDPGMVDTRLQADYRETSAQKLGEPLLAKLRGYQERGQLMRPELPARLIGRVVASGWHGEVVRFYEERCKALLQEPAP